MTCNHGIALIVFIAVILAIGAIPYQLLFKRYCERVAELEGRTEEFRSLKAPEGGMNWFEIEQSGKLWRRYYRKFNDERLTKMGDRLLTMAIPGLLGIASLLCVIISVKTVVCSA
jgi:hypothetical protein